MTTGTGGQLPTSAERLEVALQALGKEVILMRKHRKDTPKRRTRPVQPELIVKMLLATGSVLTGLAALIQALKP